MACHIRGLLFCRFLVKYPTAFDHILHRHIACSNLVEPVTGMPKLWGSAPLATQENDVQLVGEQYHDFVSLATLSSVG